MTAASVHQQGQAGHQQRSTQGGRRSTALTTFFTRAAAASSPCREVQVSYGGDTTICVVGGRGGWEGCRQGCQQLSTGTTGKPSPTGQAAEGRAGQLPTPRAAAELLLQLERAVCSLPPPALARDLATTTHRLPSHQHQTRTSSSTTIRSPSQRQGSVLARASKMA